MGFALADIRVSSSAFQPGGSIPARHTGSGEDISPELHWSSLPEDTRELAVFCHDPDAPLVKPGAYGFTHWLLYNLPADTPGLTEGTREGTPGGNDFGGVGYNGPAPPEGHGTHHYYFWVLALDREMDLDEGLSLEEFLRQAEPHIIGMNRVVGTYEKS